MTAKAFARGHPTSYTGGKWRYDDTGEPVDCWRPCARCGEVATSEGHDACLGSIPGAIAACCGHGVEKPYVMYKR